MSRRFGRNQKRKMRAQITEEQQLNKKSLGEIQYWISQANFNKSTVDRCHRLLGEYFIGFDSKLIHENSSADYLSDFRVPLFKRSSVTSPLMDCLDINESMKIINLEKMLFRIEEDRLDSGLRGMMHLRVELNTSRGKRFAYCINSEALSILPDDYLIEMLSDNFARMLTKELKGKNV